MGYWKEAKADLDEIGDPTDGIDIEKEMKEVMMNEYTVKSTSYAQVEAKDRQSAIDEYKENVLEYICDDWEVEVIDDEEDYDGEESLINKEQTRISEGIDLKDDISFDPMENSRGLVI